MKSNKKIALVLITGLLAVSFIATAPMNSKAASASEIYQSYTGHDLSESHWSIVYDWVGSNLEEDHNPGPYNESLNEGKNDEIPGVDSKYYFAWNNLHNVHSLYMAMQNYTWDVFNYNSSLYGCAPYQMFLQHFQLPEMPNYHAFILNKFLGLMAYKDAPDGISGLPDENDSLYLGWTRFSEWHKFLTNSLFKIKGVPEYYHIDERKQGRATPIKMTYNSTEEIYEFGMCYEDIFVLWQSIDVEEGKDQTITRTEVLNNCSAFGMFSSINFTFKIHSEASNTNPGYNEVTTTTEYNIGGLDDLWVIGDNSSTASIFNGSSFNINLNSKNIDIGHYNSTDDGISDRLAGNENASGFGLSVINTAKINLFRIGDWGIPHQIDVNFTNPSGESLGNTFMDISQSEFTYEEKPVYKINFASKPNYTWNGKETYAAPTRILKNAKIRTNTDSFMDLRIKGALSPLVGNLTGSSWGKLLTWNPNFFGEQYFSITCFPKWQGKSISQDPTFTVLVASEDQKGIPGFELTVVGLVGLCSVSFLAYKVWKKKKLE